MLTTNQGLSIGRHIEGMENVVASIDRLILSGVRIEMQEYRMMIAARSYLIELSTRGFYHQRGGGIFFYIILAIGMLHLGEFAFHRIGSHYAFGTKGIDVAVIHIHILQFSPNWIERQTQLRLRSHQCYIRSWIRGMVHDHPNPHACYLQKHPL